MKLLIIEDERDLNLSLTKLLKTQSYSVDSAFDGEEGMDFIAVSDYDVIILDVMMPKMDGFTFIQELRQSGSKVPVLMLTAKDTVEDKITGLDLGADDYLVKPFAISELLARIRAVVRRQGGQAVSILSNGVLALNLATHQATSGETSVLLSAREFALLHSLLLHPGRIFSREELEEHIYGASEAVESNAIDFLIHGIRKKIGMQAIKNVRGAGWMVAACR